MATSEEQRELDHATIKIRLIENGIIVSGGLHGWFSFENWNEAAAHIEARLEALRKKRQEATQ